jgi:uncharacterized Zn finger protein
MSWRDYGDYGYDEYDDFVDVDCDEHETPPDAIVIDGPIHAISKRGEIGTEWWGKQWVAAVDRFYFDNRLQRGRSYARNGSVQRLEISYGSAYAPVQGSRRFPYCVEISLNPFTKAEWDEAFAALAGQAIYSAKLLAGEMPADIEDVFKSINLSLFPRNPKDIVFECTCPDYGNPCKHASAVYYLLAEQIDADPFVLFHLRGRTREQMLSALRSYRSAATGTATDQPSVVAPTVADSEPLDADLVGFWSGVGGSLINSVPTTPKKPPFLLQLGHPPEAIGGDLEAIYKQISAEAELWLGL